MGERELPRVVLRGPADGDAIILPMGGLKARITRKAARTETGGHWAFGEAWQDPHFDNPPHTHDEAEAFYVLEGNYTFYTDTDPGRGNRTWHLRLHPAGHSPRIPNWSRRWATALPVAIDRRGSLLRLTVLRSGDPPSS